MKRTRLQLIILALYILLTLLLTFPWMLHFGDAFPGTATWAFDESTFVWNIWRFKHNLLDLQMSPLYTTDIFFPPGIDLVLYTYNFQNALLGLPLLLGLNLTLASNFTILLAYVLSGYGTYLLIRYLLPRRAGNTPTGHAAAFIGGAVYAFLASRAIFAALGHYDIVSTEFIPFFTLFFIKTVREPGWKNPVLAGIFAALSLLAEMIFGVFLLFLGIVILLFEFGRLPAVSRQRSAGSRQWAAVLRLVLLAATAAIFWSPVMLPILKAFLAGGFDLTGWGESLKLSADLVGWFTPTALHPLWGSDWVARLRQVQEGTAPFSDVNTVFLGFGVLALAVIGAVSHWRRAKLWVTGAVMFAIFTLGPVLQIRGKFLFPFDNLFREQGIAQDVTFPLPFALLHWLPIIRANRVPARFSVVLGLSLAVLVGFGAFKILQIFNAKCKIQNAKLTNRQSPITNHQSPIILFTATAILLAFVLFDQISVPLPLTSAKVPSVYAQIGAEAGDFSLMQLPLGWRNSFGVYGAERTQIQYYQTVHQKPMLGGNISRAPAFKFDYYRNIPLFRAIAQTELPTADPAVDPDTLAKAARQASELMTLYNVRYLVIHDPIPGRKPYEDTFTATRQLAFDLLPLDPDPTFAGDGVAAYRVNQSPIPNPLRLEFGDWTGAPYRGDGWAGDENFEGAGVNWAIAPTAEIFVPYRGTGDRTLKMHLKPFNYPGAPSQVMTVRVNGQPAGEFPLSPDWQVLETTLPAARFSPGLNRIELAFAHTAVPREVLPAQTAIGTTGISVPRDVEINSSADFSFVTVGYGDDAEDASAHRRGINVTVLNPQTGAIVAKKGFDTAANQYEDAALRDFLAKIPDGQIVLVSSKGADAGAFLSGGFEMLGGSAGVPAMPYSLIGVKGAAVGAAAESPDGYLRLGRNPDDRSLAVAVDWVEISR